MYATGALTLLRVGVRTLSAPVRPRAPTGAHPYIGGNMNRVTCAHCGKQFRNESGLAYHLGWAHKPAGPAEMDCDEEAAAAREAESARVLNKLFGDGGLAGGE